MLRTRVNTTGRVLVVNTDTQIGLAGLRSLGRKGVETHAAQTSRGGLGSCSRYCGGLLILPEDVDEFATAVLAYIRRHRITHLIATSEREVFLLNERRAELEQAVEPLFPRQSVADRALYKDRTLAIARKCGIEVPRTIYLRTLEDVLKCEELPFPVVLKPRHRNPRGGIHAGFHAKVMRFESLHDLVEAVTPYVNCPDPLMAQEYVKGCGVGVSILLRAGEPFCLCQHVRVREDPPAGGVSVFCRTVPLDRNLVDQSVALLRAMEWEGVAMVEYRWDPEARRAVLMEVNGRFWGSLPLALHAGADFPYLLYKSSFERCEPQTGKAGVFARSLFGDTKWIYLVSGSRCRPGLRALAEYLAAFRPGIKYFVWAWDDPVPALRKLLGSFSRLIRTGSFRESRRPGSPSSRQHRSENVRVR